jgi:hypothetical protein
MPATVNRIMLPIVHQFSIIQLIGLRFKVKGIRLDVGGRTFGCWRIEVQGWRPKL